jgi:uncharacterized protein (TIGR03437 family)
MIRHHGRYTEERMSRLRFALLVLLTIGVAAGQTPAISEIVNGASYIDQGLPNAGIAEGAIFVVKGSNLGPSPIAIASSPFQNTNVGGTSVSITVGSTTVSALMYYASAAQVAALLPSSTPTGSGTLTVTYNGTPSATAAVSIVQNNLGIFTLSQDGQGVAIVTYPNYSLVSAIPGTGSLACPASATVCPYTFGGAAIPGDTLILWATGLGPITGSDAAMAGLGVNMPNIPLKLWLGGVAATVTYQGRSGCCIGEDQISFTVPSNAPTGCAVPLAVQIGNDVSNYAAIPIAAGGRSCTPQNPAFSGAAGQALTTGTGPVTYASLSLGRTIGSESSSGTSYEDIGVGDFAQVSVTALNQPTVLSSVDTPPLGTCTTSNSSASSQPLFTVVTGIDAGAITVNAPFPDFPVVMKEQKGTGQATTYSAVFSPSGVYFSGGAYTIAAAGGADVAKFTIPFTITQTPSWPSSDQARIFNNGNGVVRTNGVTINWTGGSSAYWVVITGSAVASAPDIVNGSVSASFSCWVPSMTTPGSTAGTFTVPASVLLTLPGGNGGELDFKPTLPPLGFSATGLEVGYLSFQYETSFFTPLN